MLRMGRMELGQKRNSQIMQRGYTCFLLESIESTNAPFYLQYLSFCLYLYLSARAHRQDSISVPYGRRRPRLASPSCPSGESERTGIAAVACHKWQGGDCWVSQRLLLSRLPLCIRRQHQMLLPNRPSARYACTGLSESSFCIARPALVKCSHYPTVRRWSGSGKHRTVAKHLLAGTISTSAAPAVEPQLRQPATTLGTA